MAIFPCPSCAQPLEADPAHRDWTVRCPHCAAEFVPERVAAGTLHLSGWWFDVSSGSMYAYDRARCSFELIDREAADRLFPGQLG